MNQQLELFPSEDTSTEAFKIKDTKNSTAGKPRLATACRNQYEFKPCTLDDLLPKEHLARDIWKYVERLDLSIILGKIQSVDGVAGRSATCPKILLSLWLFATIKRISSARMIEEYCHEHDAYKWICGGVNVGYHTISDFRSDYGDQLDDLLTQSVAILSNQGLISLEEVSQDGMRVRANAGGSSFRREVTLQDQLFLAKMLVKDLNDEAKNNPGACRSRQAVAARRAAEEKEKNLELALEQLNKLREDKKAQAKKDRKKFDETEEQKVRASTTDPEARVMKMACSGFRPAFNVQFATTNKGKGIIGVDVINKGSDSEQVLAMMNQIKDRYGCKIYKYMADTGFNVHLEEDEINKQFPECKTYMPPKYKKTMEKSKSQAVRNLVNRMETEEGKKDYKKRCETAEFANAQSRNKGLQQFLVRGLRKVKNVVILFAVAHNMQILLNHCSLSH